MTSGNTLRHIVSGSSDWAQMEEGATVNGKPGDVKVALSWDGEDFSAHIEWPGGPENVPLGTGNLQGAKGMATHYMVQRGYTELKKWRETRAAADAATELPNGVLPIRVRLVTREFRPLLEDPA